MPFTAQINLELCNYFKIETLTESFALFNLLTFPSPKKVLFKSLICLHQHFNTIWSFLVETKALQKSTLSR